ncbi:MAG: NADPH-dependent ferric siderophore reductase [Betaproteobacteria bacterium HGW-Betaproteobacteria-9]|jgi:NADPH-dependent ferric siderophore reductase|nr:MAG: NADPH-dependent ferric siderophore reductase [Betaproteobacteria bacterium HGW-Betaproteobacteria-9]
MSSTPLFDTAPAGPRVQRVRHELKRRRVQVQRVERLSLHMCSITFGGEALADFVSLSFDDHIKLFLPANDDSAWVARDYTPRRFDAAARELCIEFALHGDGPAANWARQARPGQTVEIGGPRGSFIVPPDLSWHLLVGDSSALPAIARRLEELPASATAWAIVQMPDAADHRVLGHAGQRQPLWVGDDAQCLDAVRALTLPAGEGFVWCAGEATAMQVLRRVLLEEKGVDRHALRASAYWKRGTQAHHGQLGDAGE